MPGARGMFIEGHDACETAAADAAAGPIEVDIWTWHLAASPEELAEFSPLLSADERQRAARFLMVEDRDRYVTGRARLRQILARYVALMPEALTFCYGQYGKPSLALPCSAPLFNLSHSGGVAALAVVRGCEIGIDIEQVRDVPPAIAKRFFSASENLALQELSAADWLPSFFRCWTRKEAIVKAIGTGLGMPLDSFAVSLAPGAPARVLHVDGRRDEGAQWTIVDVAAGANLVGALAARTMGVELSVRRLSWESDKDVPEKRCSPQ
jgi:4'-phosphopantetheinyl transferase